MTTINVMLTTVEISDIFHEEHTKNYYLYPSAMTFVFLKFQEAFKDIETVITVYLYAKTKRFLQIIDRPHWYHKGYNGKK